MGPRPGVIHMAVSRERLQRSLLIVHGLISGSVRRGHEVEPYSGGRYVARPGVAIVVGDHHYAIEVHEETRTFLLLRQR